LRCSITGKAILPKVAVAAMVEPLMAPNTALPQITETASPPGKWPTHLSMALNRRSLTPVLPRMEPIRMNSGMAVRVNEFKESHMEKAIWFMG
jgi:hypothetical protein